MCLLLVTKPLCLLVSTSTLKGGGIMQKKHLKKKSYLDFTGSVGLVDFFIILGCRFAGEKRCPKRPIATPTIRLPVAVKCGRGVT